MGPLLHRLRYLLRRRQFDDDLAEEMDFHRESKQRELERAGRTPDEAAYAASRALGSAALAQDHARDVWRPRWLQGLEQDLRDATRSLKRAPGLAAAIVTMIALVIGGNATVFSIIHGILTKPAPGVHASGLVTIDLTVNGNPYDGGNSYPNYLDYAAQSTAVRPLSIADFQHFTLTTPDGSYAIRGDLVSTNYFATLDVRPIEGRTFVIDDDRADAPSLPAVISERLWQRQLAHAPGIVGQRVTLNGHLATIVGVAPPRFAGAVLGESSDVWVPLVAYSRIHKIERDLMDRAHMGMWIFGTLAPSASLTQAQSEFAVISRRLQTAHPDVNHGQIALPIAYAAIGTGSLLSRQGDRLLAIFSVITLLTVLIVCANVANLILARTAVRQRELALRQSLGASRARIVRMLLVEGVLVSLVAWLVACTCAIAVSSLLVRLLQPDPSGTTLNWDFTPDWKVAAYAMLLALFGALAFTLAPAIRVLRQAVLPHLKAGDHSVAQGRSRLSSALVVLQLAFSILLLTAAGLAYRSLASMSQLGLGFSTHGLLLASINTAGSAATPDANRLLLAQIQERLRATPGVTSVSHVRWVSGSGGEPLRLHPTDAPVRAEQNFVGPEYLSVLGMAPLAGREFLAREQRLANPGVIVNQHLAETLWPGQSPIGQTMLVGEELQRADVVGVTRDAFFNGFTRNARPNFIFRSEFQEPSPPGETTFYVRYTGNLDAAAAAFGRVLRDVSTTVPIVSMRTMDAQLQSQKWPVMTISTLLIVFAIGSLTIAVIGQYAAVAFSMRRRTRDFGVRIALGASSQRILSSVLREGMRMTVAGLLSGMTLSAAASYVLRGLLYGVGPADARTYLAVSTLLVAASLTACYLPARRATRIDPAVTLRAE